MIVKINGSDSPSNSSSVPKGSIAAILFTIEEVLNEALMPAAENNSKGPINITLK